ncbi:TlpA disulfide reductase family protein [Aquabacterium sp. NJ1]|uniref:TlpA disulfide reductase family protein n=1 Tax=Aquabacterium sp. NJ1 TaxID=1538295 RepID=UPI00068F90CF|nr:TlpA disulfide reductase family protein [Aquabacterium sp. NJ1]
MSSSPAKVHLACQHPTRRQALAALTALAGSVAAGRAQAWGEPPAVSIKGPLLDGQAFASEALKGQVLLVNFWASWCPLCRAEMPEIEAYYRAHRAQGLTVLALSMDEPEDEAKVRELAKGWSFPVAMMQQIKLSGFDRIWRMPVSAVIDRQGKLVRQDWFVQTGLNAALLDAVIKPLL